MSGGDRATFIAGDDYHLGDLLWLTAVIAEYRMQRRPAEVQVSVPDRDVSRILENNPEIDTVDYGCHHSPRWSVGRRDPHAAIHDLRPMSLAVGMVRQWRRRAPWLYYRDLWLEPRGQWLATYLGLGRMHSYKPRLTLSEDDFRSARQFSGPYVVLAPHIGSYSLPLTGRLWRKLKGWEDGKWVELASRLRSMGLETLTLGGRDQTAVAGTVPVLGIPIRQAAGVISQAAAVVSGESGLWFVAAALDVPFVIVPWWLPRAVDWPAEMGARSRLVRKSEASVERVLGAMEDLRARPDMSEPRAVTA